jgi:hypothetical protein
LSLDGFVTGPNGGVGNPLGDEEGGFTIGCLLERIRRRRSSATSALCGRVTQSSKPSRRSRLSYPRSSSTRQLVVSPKTAGNHIEHIYTKIDATNRATASLFAVQHGLLPEEELVTATPP